MNKIIIEQFSENEWAGILVDENRLKACTFLKHNKEAVINYLKQFSDGNFVVEESSHTLLSLIKKIRYGEYYTLPRIDFDFDGYTQKEIKVLNIVADIPFGETASYGEVAQRAGLRNAARFVGNVMRKNRFAPIIPCHRVVRTDGKIGNYSISLNDPKKGRSIKKKLIEQEKRR